MSTLDDISHEIWAAAQLLPGEGIVDGVDRISAILQKEFCSENECSGCKYYGGLVPDCMAPSFTVCPKENLSETQQNKKANGNELSAKRSDTV